MLDLETINIFYWLESLWQPFYGWQYTSQWYPFWGDIHYLFLNSKRAHRFSRTEDSWSTVYVSFKIHTVATLFWLDLHIKAILQKCIHVQAWIKHIYTYGGIARINLYLRRFIHLLWDFSKLKLVITIKIGSCQWLYFSGAYVVHWAGSGKHHIYLVVSAKCCRAKIWALNVPFPFNVFLGLIFLLNYKTTAE